MRLLQILSTTLKNKIILQEIAKTKKVTSGAARLLADPDTAINQEKKCFFEAMVNWVTSNSKS